jgi:hypothetical protein
VTTKNVEKGISDIVGALTDPIIVFPGGGWENDIPDWLKTRITLDRLVMNMRALKGEEMTGTDSEALAYMMPASLAFPLDHDWTEIYLYLGTKVCSGENKVFPDDIRKDNITDDQMRDLNRLKEWIYRRRVQARLDGDRVERRQKKEEETARRKAEQPALFHF